MEKKWYKVTFYAEMSEDDVKAMKGNFYSAMEEAMEIPGCEGLEIEEDTEIGACSEAMDSIRLEDDDFILEPNGDIKIDKQVYDLFVQDAYIDILFDDGSVDRYKMVKEDDEYIYCEYITNLI